MEAVIEYLKNNNGYDHKLYNRLCPSYGEPDSNIVEYAEDIFQETFIVVWQSRHFIYYVPGRT